MIRYERVKGRMRVASFVDVIASVKDVDEQRRKKVGIVGAGLAGLCAGWLLSKAGHDVTIIEASDRVGGRVLTLKFGTQVAEAGALFIPGYHDLVNGFVDELQLSLRKIPLPRPVLHIDGQLIPDPQDPTKWPKALGLTAEESAMALRDIYSKAYGGFPDIGDPRKTYWPGKNKAVLKLDRTTTYEFLKERNLSEPAIKLARLGMPDALGDGIKRCSVLALLRDATLYQVDTQARLATDISNNRLSGSTRVPDDSPLDIAAGIADEDKTASDALKAIDGGNQQLAEKFAASGKLKAWRLVKNAEVKSISETEAGLTVAYREGGQMQSLDFHHVISAIPFSLLRFVDLELNGMTREKDAAIKGLRHTDAVRVLLQTNRFWEKGGHSGHVLTDKTERFITHQTEGLADETGILDALSTGGWGRRLASRKAKGPVEHMLETLKQVYGIGDADINVQNKEVVDWGKAEWAKGAYCWFAPGEHARFVPHLAPPIGRLHFAGDQTSISPGWMEGALESGVRAAQEISEAP